MCSKFLKYLLLFVFIFSIFTKGYASADSLAVQIQAFEELDYPERGRQIVNYLDNSKVDASVRSKRLQAEVDYAMSIEGEAEVKAILLVALADAYKDYGKLSKASEAVLQCKELIDFYGTGEREWRKITADLKLQQAENLYRESSNDEAIANLLSAINIYEEIGELEKLDKFYTQLGVYHSEKGSSDTALIYYEKALPYAIEQKDTSQILRIEFCRAADYSLLEEWEPVKKIVTKILPDLKKRNHPKK